MVGNKNIPEKPLNSFGRSLVFGEPGPFQIIEHETLDIPSMAPKRRYACPNYETCLGLAAAFNWDSFTCRGCSGEMNQSFLWRAQQSMRKDPIAQEICSSSLPEPTCVVREEESSFETPRLKIVNK